MPTHESLGLDDRDDLEDRREPSIELDEEEAVAVRKPTRPFTFRRSTISCCRSAAFSASSRLFDLNGDVRMTSRKRISAIIALA